MPFPRDKFGEGGGLERGKPIEPKGVGGIDAHDALESEESGGLRETGLDATKEMRGDFDPLGDHVYANGARVGEEGAGDSVLHQRGNV